MDVLEQNGGGSSIELWLAEREDPGVDSELRRRVREALDWEPGLDPTRLEIKVRSRAVTLRGVVRGYPERVAARSAVERVPKVSQVIDEIMVELPAHHERTDQALLEEVTNLLSWDAQVPADHLHVSVRDGHITLEGWVEWDYQREAAEQAVRALIGVRAIENRITVRPKWVTAELQPAVVAALRHHRELHTRHVTVDTRNGVVRLRGRVPSLAERSAIKTTVWTVPGVTEVVDEIAIDR